MIDLLEGLAADAWVVGFQVIVSILIIAFVAFIAVSAESLTQWRPNARKRF